ncbi:MAG: site-specific DNA-methyltransferase [Acidobacteria bacterium]|nr:site-specific DNA-methyltransferase [Acidobacteriota bacterium]
MREVSDESIHLIITSPPYWQLKDYGVVGQIGFYDSYEDYINNLNLVWKECLRVLHKGCRLCINIGDQFARSVYYGRYKVIPIRTEIIKFCESIGFDYMGAIIWQKVTTCNTTGGATVMGSYPYPRNGILKIDYEFILIFRKPGRAPKVKRELKELSRLSDKEWNEYFSGHWNFPGERQEKHLAMFPIELPKRLIKMFSFVGDTVLDPFLGSGTTARAAKDLGRNSIGYEINKDFLPLIKAKLGVNEGDLFTNAQIEIVEQGNLEVDFEKKVRELPYIFSDPGKFDKVTDPKKFNFGSKVSSFQQKGDNFYRVTEVITPESLILDNGLKIKLIGVKEKRETAEKAVNFLKERLKGRKVFFKFDSLLYPNKGSDFLLCYLYLRNRTFINAHLIKRGLVEVDTSYEYRYKSRFLKLRNSING